MPPQEDRPLSVQDAADSRRPRWLDGVSEPLPLGRNERRTRYREPRLSAHALRYTIGKEQQQGAGVLGTTAAVGEPGATLQALELTFREWIVFGHARAAMVFRDAPAGQQLGNRLGFHR